MELSLVVIVVAVALVFDYINGFHDAANSIATVVSTRVLSPGKAVLWAAFFNFAAAFIFGTAVAKTIGSGMIDIEVVTGSVILGGLIGAIVWDLITWYYGLPTSSSHALIGGYAGAAIAKAGLPAIVVAGWTKTLMFIVLAPLIGLVARAGLHDRHHVDLPRVRRPPESTSGSASCSWCRRRSTAWVTARTTRRRPWASSPARSTPAATSTTFEIPTWVIFAAYAAISPARYRAAGASSTRWARRSRGCSRSAASPLKQPARCRSSLASSLGMPVSTTHTITGAIVGVGSVRRLSAVRWGIAGQIVWAWVLTIPAAAIIAAATYYMLAAGGLH